MRSNIPFSCCLLVKHNLLLAFFTLLEKYFKPGMSDPIHVCPDILSDECLKVILSLELDSVLELIDEPQLDQQSENGEQSGRNSPEYNGIYKVKCHSSPPSEI